MIARASRRFEGILVATDHWPVILLEFPEHRTADAAVQESLGFIEGLLNDAKDAGEMTYQVTDLTHMRKLPPESQRKYAADWVGRTLPLHKVSSLGGVNVTPSAILRGMVILINWWQESSRPTLFVASRKEAYATALAAFDKANVPLRPDVRTRIRAA